MQESPNYVRPYCSYLFFLQQRTSHMNQEFLRGIRGIAQQLHPIMCFFCCTFSGWLYFAEPFHRSRRHLRYTTTTTEEPEKSLADSFAPGVAKHRVGAGKAQLCPSCAINLESHRTLSYLFYWLLLFSPAGP